MEKSKFLEMNRFEWSETNDGREWDDFVTRNGGSIYHLWSWRKFLESSYSGPLYLVCRDAQDKIVAVCPFFHWTDRRLLYLNSLPDSHTAGLILEEGMANASPILASLGKSVKFSLFNPVVAMLMRVHLPQIAQPMIGLGYRYDLTCGLIITDLHEKSPEHIWNNGFQKHDRQAVKYYEQSGPGFAFASGERDYTDFLALQRGSWRTNRAEFLSRARSYLGDQLKVATVTHNDDVVAGILMLCDTTSSTIHLTMMRFSPSRNIHSPVTYMNWKAINWAHEHGFRYVDFGAYPEAKSSSSLHPFHRLRMRFEADAVPRYEFFIPTSGISCSIARRISRLL